MALPKILVASFLKALQGDLSALSPDQAESADVAIQCLKDIYGVADEQVASAPELATFSTARAVSDEDKTRAEQLKAKGNEHLAAKRYADALAAYNEAISLNPCSAIYYANRAAVHAALECHEESIEDARKAVELNAGYAKGHSRLGMSCFALGRYEESVAAYERAAALEPENVATKASLESARAKVASKKPAEAAGFDFGSLAGMNLSQLASNPALMQMASQMAESGKLRELMKSPMAQQMMQGLMGGAANSKRDASGQKAPESAESGGDE